MCLSWLYPTFVYSAKIKTLIPREEWTERRKKTDLKKRWLKVTYDQYARNCWEAEREESCPKSPVAAPPALHPCLLCRGTRMFQRALPLPQATRRMPVVCAHAHAETETERVKWIMGISTSINSNTFIKYNNLKDSKDPWCICIKQILKVINSEGEEVFL